MCKNQNKLEKPNWYGYCSNKKFVVVFESFTNSKKMIYLAVLLDLSSKSTNKYVLFFNTLKINRCVTVNEGLIRTTCSRRESRNYSEMILMPKF